LTETEITEREDAPKIITEAKRIAADPDTEPDLLMYAARNLVSFGLYDEARRAVERLEPSGLYRQELRHLRFTIERLGDKTPAFQEQLLVNAIRLARKADATNDQLVAAADKLIRWGALDDADRALDTLERRGAGGKGIRSLRAIGRQLRRSGILDTFTVIGQPLVRGLSRPYEALLSEQQDGSDRAIIVFTGAARRFYVSLHVLHHFLRQYGAHIIYLSDHRNLMFLDGLTGQPRGYDDLRALIEDTLTNLGADKIHVMGSSAGGFIGLRMAADISARSYLGMSIRTDLSGKVRIRDYERRALARCEHKAMAIDLLPYLKQRTTPEHIYLCCGDSSVVDLAHARNLERLPNATLRLVEGYRLHDVTPGLLERGEFQGLLDRFVDGAG
jgi:hypothetical protein